MKKELRNWQISDYITLTKPGLTFVSVSTAVGGAFLGLREQGSYILLLHVFIGAYLAGAGAGALNQYFERYTDSRMTRTGSRPLPAMRIPWNYALIFGLSLSLTGIIYLILFTTLLSGLLTVTTLIIYLAVYTPMKRKTPLALYIGGIAGALPPMIGWMGVNSKISLGGLSLLLILFLWQIPHFLSLAWIYREDYGRAGYKISTVIDASGLSAARQIIFSSFLLIPVSLLPAIAGIGGLFYLCIALMISIVLLAAGILFYQQRKEENARRLFIVSIIYIPLLYTSLVIDALFI